MDRDVCLMRLAFRWFDSTDTIPLRYIRQIPGMTGIVSALYDLVPGEVWPVDLLAAMRRRVEKADLEFRIIESIPIHEDIKLGGKRGTSVSTRGYGASRRWPRRSARDRVRPDPRNLLSLPIISCRCSTGPGATWPASCPMAQRRWPIRRTPWQGWIRSTANWNCRVGWPAIPTTSWRGCSMNTAVLHRRPYTAIPYHSCGMWLPRPRDWESDWRCIPTIRPGRSLAYPA